MALTKEQFETLRNQGLTVEQIVKFESGQTPELDKKKLNTAQKLGNVLIGAGKGALTTVKGASSLGEKLVTGVGRILTPKSMEEKLGFSKQEQTGAEKLIPESLTEATNTYQKIGKFGEQVAEFAIPATKVGTATKGLSLAKQLLTRAATSGAVATAQSGQVGKETAIASGVELALPGVGKAIKPVINIVKRLFTGLGAGLSGASTNELKVIANNPKIAQQFSQIIKKEGQEAVLEKNAKTILNGVSKIRQEARSAYAKGLDVLEKTDIKPSVIKNNVLSLLDKNGIKIVNKKLSLKNSEILNPTIQKKAKNLILELNGKISASGKDIRSFMDKLEASKFKSALDPDRQAFNNLVNDIGNGLKKAISESTNKLDDINKMYSKEMDLAQGIENIFGKVKFKNTTELNKVAKKLEGLFSQKGLDESTVNNFLERIGIPTNEFRTSEAVRGIMSKTTGANTKGLTFGEILQQITSSVVTPEAVKNIAIATGIAENVLNSIIKNTAPGVRGAIIKSIIGEEK